MPHGAVYGHYRHPKPTLKRSLTLFELVMYGVGLILGAGIYVLLGRGAEIAGNAVWLSFIFGAIICAFTGLSYCELSSRFPKESSEYLYTKKAFNSHIFSFITGWILVFAGAFSATTVALGFGEYFAKLFSMNFSYTPFLAAAVLVLISFINFWGIKESALLNVLFTLVEMSGLLIIIFIGLPYLGSVNYFETPNGFVFNDLTSIMAAASLIFFAFIGFDEMPKIIEEVKNGRKIMPKGLIYALTISTILYILVAISAVSIIPWNHLKEAPLSSVVGNIWGTNGILLMSVIALFATFNTILGTLIGFSRLLYGMAEMRGMPSILSKIHSKRRTPHYAIFCIMCMSLLFLLVGDISVVASVTDLALFLVFFITNASLIVLRYKDYKSGRQSMQKFRAPLNIGWFPLTALLGIVSVLSLILHFEPIIYIYEIVVIVIGIALYWLINTHFNKSRKK